MKKHSLDDMICMYVLRKPSKREYHFPFIEFSFNNGYQESLNMSPMVVYKKVCIGHQ